MKILAQQVWKVYCYRFIEQISPFIQIIGAVAAQKRAKDYLSLRGEYLSNEKEISPETHWLCFVSIFRYTLNFSLFKIT